jgi:hypothetical protein
MEPSEQVLQKSTEHPVKRREPPRIRISRRVYKTMAGFSVKTPKNLLIHFNMLTIFPYKKNCKNTIAKQFFHFILLSFFLIFSPLARLNGISLLPPSRLQNEGDGQKSNPF